MANKPRQIRERREKIQLLMSRGMSQINIAKELGVTRRTIIRDLGSMTYQDMDYMIWLKLLLPYVTVAFKA